MRGAASVFERLAAEEREHLGTLEKRYAELVAQDPLLESRPTFLFFKGAASGLFAEGAEKLRSGVDDQQALLIGIKCERGSHKFFKRYGERFEDSEGKRIFLEFADEERAHLDLLIGEYRALRERQGTRRSPRRGQRLARRRALIDLHTHTTASDGRCTPAELVARAARGGVTVLSVTDHDTVAGCASRGARARAAGIEFVPGIEITAVARRRRRPRARLLHRRRSESLLAFLRTAPPPDRSASAHRRTAGGARHPARRRRDPRARPRGPSTSGRPAVDRARARRAGHVRHREAFERWLATGRPRSCPGWLPRRGSLRQNPRGGRDRVARASGLLDQDDWIPGFAAAGLDALEAYHSGTTRDTERYLRSLAGLGLAVSGGSDFHGDEMHGPGGPGSVSLPRDAFDRLKALGALDRVGASSVHLTGLHHPQIQPCSQIRACDNHDGQCQALLTAVALGTIGQGATAVLGLLGTDASRVTSPSVFSRR